VVEPPLADPDLPVGYLTFFLVSLLGARHEEHPVEGGHGGRDLRVDIVPPIAFAGSWAGSERVPACGVGPASSGR